MLDPVVEPGELTELDRFIFESWGYFIIPDVLNQDEIRSVLEASQRLHSGHKGVFQQVGNGFEREPSIERLLDHPAVLPKVRGLYQSDNVIVQAAWCTLQPAHGKTGGWHQDGSSAFDFRQLGYPIPLLQLRVSYLLTDQTRPGMGNLELIPGSHRSRVPLPEHVRTEHAETPISHIVCAPAGSALVFHNAVWHRAYEHNEDYDRYTMHFVYSPPWMRYADRFENTEAFLARTTPVRRGLMGDLSKPDAAYAGGYHTPPYLP
ncbi:phytanoyl-CoA dioxygenase family protein [Alicyclobacillus fodiniaquatilis]|jgi:ectoine hydroxylase-related dioxygenase (phytanoyl-CoA dioxygenase family)|uniref:Phytanoyl-CoA dioxygenase family protein n=1 Tax=Alicyclobacillus fodiniaquatilis TaxID=1661150 RepID=A0ABW4JHU7_9BACL